MWSDHTDRRVTRYLQLLSTADLLEAAQDSQIGLASNDVSAMQPLPRLIVGNLQRKGIPPSRLLDRQSAVDRSRFTLYMYIEYRRWTYNWNETNPTLSSDDPSDGSLDSDENTAQPQQRLLLLRVREVVQNFGEMDRTRISDVICRYWDKVCYPTSQ